MSQSVGVLGLKIFDTYASHNNSTHMCQFLHREAARIICVNFSSRSDAYHMCQILSRRVEAHNISKKYLTIFQFSLYSFDIEKIFLSPD
ncbi:MAG TPA: hypothetical protein PK899_06970 [Spirochaetota bacterium]|nr:hypothetical protein [Spirochaetota bacterium]